MMISKLIHNSKKISRKTNIVFIAMFVLLTLFDQITKYYAVHTIQNKDIILIPGVLEFHYLENTGAAWGMLKNQMVFLIVVPILVLLILLYAYFRIPADKKFTLLRFCLVLLAAGAIGNMIDRITNQYVIDFIYFSLINFPIFNVADCYVCISAALIIVCILFIYKDEDFSYEE